MKYAPREARVSPFGVMLIALFVAGYSTTMDAQDALIVAFVCWLGAD